MEPTDPKRRKLLKILGTGTAVGIGATATGCLNGGSEDEEPDDEDGEDGGNGTDTETGEGEQVTVEPVGVPEDAGCPVCEMTPVNFPDWNAQAVHEDGERAYFCSSGCMVAYKTYPDEFSVSETEIAGVWVTGLETRELIDGREAHYALETDAERLDDPMMTNPAPFEVREEAVAYVEEVEYLAEEDIVEYGDLDTDWADIYRGQLTPGGGES